MWPEFRLTAEESKFCAKYGHPEYSYKQERSVYNPATRKTERVVEDVFVPSKTGVKTRKYYGRLRLSTTVRRPTINFQISRRSRVVGMTVAGDIERFYVQLGSSTGEQYIVDETPLVNLFPGYNADPRALSFGALTHNATEALETLAPHIFEPNLVILPNQVLILTGTPIVTDDFENYTVGITFHAVEFPNMFTPY